MRADNAAAADLLSGHPNAVYGVDWSPDGRLIASASLDNSVKLWDATTGKQVARLPGHGDGVSAVAFSPDSKTLFSSSLDRSIKIWNVGSRALVKTGTAHANGSIVSRARRSLKCRIWHVFAFSSSRTRL